MRRILLLSCVVLICLQFSNAQEKNASTKQGPVTQSLADENEIRRTQDSLIDAYLHHDYGVLDRVLADDLTYIDDDGFVLTKKQIVDMFNSGDDQIISYKRQDENIRILSETAILTYRYQVGETYKGHEVGDDMRTMRIFVKRNGEWRMVAGEDTDVNPRPTFTSVDTKDDENALMELEREWAKSTADPDEIARFIEENVTPDYRYTSSDGSVMTKVELIESSRHDHSGIATATEMHARVHGSTGVVMGAWTQGSRHLRFTDTYIRDGSNWRCVAAQTTPITATVHPASTLQLSGRDRLIGSWKQVSSEETLDDGSVVQFDEIGLLTYDATGHMSGQAMRLSEPKQRIPSDSTYQSNGYDAYFGTFTVDEEKHTVTHHVVGGVTRQLVGKDLVRSYSFDGDRLIMKPANSDERWTVVFEKNKAY